jgi:predicted DNA-binding transcriptional regulator AlpA
MDDVTKLENLEQRLTTLEAVVASFNSSEQDRLLPTNAVAERYGVTPRCLARWVDGLGFPAPQKINERKYWRESQLREWDRVRLLQSMKGTRS